MKKGVTVSTKKYYIFNIDNCSLSSKSAYENNFWRIIWHW